MTVRNSCLGVAVCGLFAIILLESDGGFRPGTLAPSGSQLVITIAAFLMTFLLGLVDFSDRSERYFRNHSHYLGVTFVGIALSVVFIAMMCYRGFYLPMWSTYLGLAGMGFVLWLRTMPQKARPDVGSQ